MLFAQFPCSIVKTPPLFIEYLVVGAGGGGAGSTGGQNGGGGGGAGEYVEGTTALAFGGSYSVVIPGGGNGGVNLASGTSGTSTTFSTITALGGGGGGMSNSIGLAGASSGGGSGGGYNASNNYAPTGRGNMGGAGSGSEGGGGGGAGSAGSSSSANLGGNGGAGYQWLNGNYYAGGGGGACYYNGALHGYGGSGIGGSSDTGVAPYSKHAVSNTGSGGGGWVGGNTNSGGNGGSGVVIFRYLGSQKGIGGTVTSNGGYTYHTFTGSSTFYLIDSVTNPYLTAYWRLDETSGNAIDSKGSYNFIQSGTVASTTGKLTNARGVFSGSNYFSIADNSPMTVQAFCVDGWFKSSNTGTHQIFFAKGTTAQEGTNGIFLGLQADGTIVFFNGSTYLGASGTAYNDNNWHYVCAGNLNTGSNNFRVYVDGVKKFENTNTGWVLNSSGIGLGATSNGGYPCTGTLLDDWAFWGTVPSSWTDIETIITQRYNSGSGLVYKV